MFLSCIVLIYVYMIYVYVFTISFLWLWWCIYYCYKKIKSEIALIKVKMNEIAKAILTFFIIMKKAVCATPRRCNTYKS